MTMEQKKSLENLEQKLSWLAVGGGLRAMSLSYILLLWTKQWKPLTQKHNL